MLGCEVVQLGIILSLILGLIIAFFAILNTEPIMLNYYFGTVRTSVALLVLSSAICGALAIAVLSFIKQVRSSFTIWGFKNKSKNLGKEVESLKDKERASADDLSFLQAENENRLREKEVEYRELVNADKLQQQLEMDEHTVKESNE